MPEELNYHTLAGLVEAARTAGQPLSALVLRQQAAQLEVSEDDVYALMRVIFAVLAACFAPGCQPDLRSASGLTGGDACKLRRRVEAGQNLTGPVVGGALYRALAVSELNAAMGRVVAAPTAGSCGILPAVLLTMQEQGASERDCVMSLFTAGAQGGCQAECGSAAAMAAAALVELCGGTPQMLDDAVAIALKCQLGLVCDPVAGLVEIPCIKRNAAGASIAFMAAELALAGIGSRIPADEVIAAMRRVGNAMSPTLKETAEGGLAATPTACRLCKQVFG